MNSYIRVPDNDSLNPSNLTLATWVNTSSTDRIWRRIFDKATRKEYDLTMAGDGDVGGPYSGRSWRGQVALEVAHQWAPSGIRVADGRWHQVVGTFDGSELRIYVDGRTVGGRPAKGQLGHAPFDLTIGENGSEPADEVGESFNGMMDDVMVFNRALSPQEIQVLYNSQMTASDAAIAPAVLPLVPRAEKSDTAAIAVRQPAVVAGRLFPKMPLATNVYVANCFKDSNEAKRSAWALQGLVNQSFAEVYIIANGQDQRSLRLSTKPFETLTALHGENPGLRTLFQKYQACVRKMFLYDPKKDWTWYLALMASAQQGGLPVTESLEQDLASEFGWNGKVEDFRDRWPNQIEAYDWALTNLMPGCSKQVVFQLFMTKPLCDYVVASRGFDFGLDSDDPEQRAETEKIYATKGYGLGTSLMGYNHDRANKIANPFGIGCVVSDNYANASLWASFPDKTYTQPPGNAIKAEPGKIYASIAWSDGDNLSFDQNELFNFWHDDPNRGTVPVGTRLNPTLQELNSPLLDWYYSNMTTNDELMCGPSGVQFIFVDDFNDRLFPAWCKLTREWCYDAGFHCCRLWNCTTPSAKLAIYKRTAGLEGFFGCGKSIQQGYPPQIDTITVRNEEELFDHFLRVKPNPRSPVFVDFELITLEFYKEGGGYSAIKRQVDRIEAAYPDRYIFLLPKDQIETIRAY
ncbi:MAG TPA: LamG-like jellyroll fold domain-containing protein [Verrucomicrobiae bacterium]|nr:LamG-like jellyroll fold domain-containing protein [Verrucomicrobiae bacterium]